MLCEFIQANSVVIQTVALLATLLVIIIYTIKTHQMKEATVECFVSAKFGQMSTFLKLQIICNNLKRGGMYDNQEKVQDFA